MMNKKSTLLTIVILILVCIILGVSYAYWQITRTQNDKNIVTTGCFEVESDIGTENELDPIRLLKTYPISDTEGKQLTPFTFTLRNTCDTYAGYQINLESLNTTTLNLDYLKVVLDNKSPKVLSAYDVVEKTLSDATTSHKLLTGGLKAGTSQTFNLRLWLDKDTPLESGQNKTYEGKIVITASPATDKSATTKILSLVEGADSTSTDVITVESDEVTCTNTLAYDGTVDNNLRYVGANPCNYACFNNECPENKSVYIITNNASGQDVGAGNFNTPEECESMRTTAGDQASNYTCTQVQKVIGGWRVIGLMNNVDDGTGKKEQRVKLIRNDSLGNYSWDVSETTINDGYGINQWGPSETYAGADLMRELNGDYLDLTLIENTTWYNGQNNKKEAIFDYTKRLNQNAQSLIGDAMWYTGAYNDTSVGGVDINASQMYINEHSNNPNSTNNGKYCTSGNDCNDIVTRTYTWTGKVALINMSDYIYATSGGTTINRNNCLTTSIKTNSYWQSNDCSQNSWINGVGQWFLSPDANPTYADCVGDVGSNGYVDIGRANFNRVVRPSVYLLSDVKISGGNGSVESPYIFE